MTVLVDVGEGWFRFGNGRQWRCIAPDYLCEIDDEGICPDYSEKTQTVAKMRRVKSFYMGRIELGLLDSQGTGIDILVANAMAESIGSVPSTLSNIELKEVLDCAAGIDIAAKLDDVVHYVAMKEKYLERREPGYGTPVSTPARVSLGAHHVLISTALQLTSKEKLSISDLVCKLPSDSFFSAKLAIRYFNRSHSVHQNNPPLLAATYNAGSPRQDPSNKWNLKQFGNHVDRWVTYYNTSRGI